MEPVILDANKRLSESILWEMMAQYFCELGVAAWTQVPFYPTSNMFVAEAYAELILAFLLDLRPRTNPEEPVYVLELGAGNGCFSYRCLRLLKRKLSHFPALSPVRLRYVMTDFAEKNVAFWETQAQLAPFVEDGTLDFAVFAPEADQNLLLRRSQRRLSPGDIKNPLVVIANYFFDGVRQDLFRVTDGQLAEGLVTLFREPSLDPPPVSQIFEELRHTVRYAPASPAYYPQVTYNRILDEYRMLYPEGTVLFPIGALRILDNLMALSGRNMVLLSSDKGFTDPDAQSGRVEHVFTRHGSLSFMVNYDALARWFRDAGGNLLATEDRYLNIVTAMGVCLAGTDSELPHCRYFFEEKIRAANPLNHLYFLQDLIDPDVFEKPDLLLRSFYSLIRLSHHDPGLFMHCAARLHRQFAAIPNELRASLSESLTEIRANDYPRGETEVPISTAILHYLLGEYDACLTICEHLLESGTDEIAQHYVAACHEALGRPPRGIASGEQARAIAPEPQGWTPPIVRRARPRDGRAR